MNLRTNSQVWQKSRGQRRLLKCINNVMGQGRVLTTEMQNWQRSEDFRSGLHLFFTLWEKKRQVHKLFFVFWRDLQEESTWVKLFGRKIGLLVWAKHNSCWQLDVFQCIYCINRTSKRKAVFYGSVNRKAYRIVLFVFSPLVKVHCPY